MVRDEKLISYLPQYIQDYREIKQILNSEDPEILTLNVEIDQFKNNQFILSCNETGIKEFEDLLKISPSPDDTLEARISRVLARWNDSIPYTYRGLIEKLDTLCGSGNYIIFPKFNDYELELTVHLPLSGQVDELEYLLSYMIPANIAVLSSNMLDYQAIGTLYTASTNIAVRSFTITSELTREIIAEGSFRNGSTLIKVLEYTIN